jgi:D-alanyl-D-alanine carboxypeptidase/D-alanyl-D-alanine-endopeptidase (penicillin-binding protein 4)
VGALALVLAAIVCFVLGLRDGEPAAAAPSADANRVAATPLLSARRVPFLFIDAAARAQLQRALTQAVGADDACVAVDLPKPAARHLAAVHSNNALAPASAQKLLTGAAALSALGPDHTFVTRARLSGNQLYLVGGGDPVLSTPGYAASLHARARTKGDPVTPLDALADAIVRSGVRSVGAIVGDDSRQDDLRFLPAWDPDYVTQVGPLGALTVDDGTAAGGHVADPAINAAAQLQTLLVARGVAVGGVGRGVAPKGARVVGEVASPKLSAIVEGMLTSSDNDTAEMLAREVGLGRGGDGSTAAGTRAVASTLASLHVPTTGLQLQDGSGLAKSNRISCDTLIGTLELGSQPKFAALDKGLPVSGRTGTLLARLAAPPLGGIVRAKTGNVDGVASLAGVVDDSQHLRFAYVVNGNFSTETGRAKADQIATIVAAYPQPPPASQLVPAP